MMKLKQVLFMGAIAAGSVAAGITAGCGEGSSGEEGGACNLGSRGGSAPEVRVPFDWTGVVGTGQSLAVGQNGTPVTSTTQPYNNLQLSTGDLDWPIAADDDALEMIPLTEPIGRHAPSYPSSWPENIASETIHSAMGNQVTALVMDAGGDDYIGVHGQFGENGQCMSYLEKGATEGEVNGRAFAASLVATEAITRLAEAEGKSYGVGAITVVHGECDAGNSGYEGDLVQLWEDYNADLKAITGQADSIQMLISQQNSVNDHSASTLAQWQVGVNNPEDIVCVGPTYQYESSDEVHLTGDGYRKLGEKFGQVYFERVVLGSDWQPLQALEVVKESQRVLSVKFHVPAPPLTWDEDLEAPHADTPEWAAGKGFEVRAVSDKLSIASVEIDCDSVRITLDEDLPESRVTVSYALYAEATARPGGMPRWGLLRDSDAFVGDTTGETQPNFAVAFELLAP